MISPGSCHDSLSQRSEKISSVLFALSPSSLSQDLFQKSGKDPLFTLGPPGCFIPRASVQGEPGLVDRMTTTGLKPISSAHGSTN